jgi:hypothetical protein
MNTRTLESRFQENAGPLLGGQSLSPLGTSYAAPRGIS